ncbi:hypothetical protein FRB95_008072 [Tulasnella sp. JGI-2019a]|nr:hypothetical protein FRB95_008072 [Tulasnella sp. JGI-2019a]
MGDVLDATKLGLTALAIGLQASPIPEPFKSAVTAIPGSVLQIIEIVEAVKGNVGDARDLALYIGQVTETAIRPLQSLSSSFSHRPLEEGISEFLQCVYRHPDAPILTNLYSFSAYLNLSRNRSALFSLSAVWHVSCITAAMLGR